MACIFIEKGLHTYAETCFALLVYGYCNFTLSFLFLKNDFYGVMNGSGKCFAIFMLILIACSLQNLFWKKIHFSQHEKSVKWMSFFLYLECFYMQHMHVCIQKHKLKGIVQKHSTIFNQTNFSSTQANTDFDAMSTCIQSGKCDKQHCFNAT